ncbi:MAG TPA: isoprenylcysteine carboxylmethyltransferase family protein [Acidobacteriota bacterium]|nr:isoprenylcysteine carboxylmethyltransferase family protein [Acidobacteriota bacterium]
MLYLAFLVLNAIEMLYEVRVSQRNSAALLAQGAIEIAPKILPVMTALYLLMYAGSFSEYWFFARPISALWAASYFSLFCAAKLLKFWSVRSLGKFWTMRVLVVPGSHAVTSGPYRWMRHPNYLAVLMEIAATTLLGKCIITCAIVLISFAATLVFRIRSEEAALIRYTDYRTAMPDLRRLAP